MLELDTQVVHRRFIKMFIHKTKYLILDAPSTNKSNI